MAETGRITALQALYVLRDIITVIVLPLCVWMLITLVDHGESIAAMEANRFTAADGMQVWQAMGERPTRAELKGEMGEIKQELMQIRQILEARR